MDIEPPDPDPPPIPSNPLLQLLEADSFISSRRSAFLKKKDNDSVDKDKKREKKSIAKPSFKGKLKSISRPIPLNDNMFQVLQTPQSPTPSPSPAPQLNDSNMMTPNTNTNVLRKRYTEQDAGPYIVHVQLKEESPSDGSTLHPIKFGNFLFKNNLKNVLEDGIKRIGRNRLAVQFKTPSAANTFLANDSLTLNYELSIPSYNISRMGIVKGIPVEWSHEEIVANIRVPEGCGPIIKTRRLSRKVSNFEGVKWSPTQSVVLTFDGQTLPERVYSFYSSLPVDQYVFPTVICYNCCRFGHTRVQCRSKPRCFKCAKDHTGSDCPESEDFQCIHCNGSHQANDKKCPEYIRQTNIKQFMSSNAVSYNEAASKFPFKKSFSSIISSSPSPAASSYSNSALPSSAAELPKSYKKTVILKQKKTNFPTTKGYDRKEHDQILSQFSIPPPQNGCGLAVNSTSDSVSSSDLNNLLASLINIIVNSTLPYNVAISLINNLTVSIYQLFNKQYGSGPSMEQ